MIRNKFLKIISLKHIATDLSGRGYRICISGEMSDQGSLRRGSVRSGNCPLGEMSVGEVSVGNLSSGMCQSGKCPVGEMSAYRNNTVTTPCKFAV